jgi:hypothetical protein
MHICVCTNKANPLKEKLSELRRLQKRYFPKFKLIQMLIVLKQKGCLNKYSGRTNKIQSSLVRNGRIFYIDQVKEGLLVENRRGPIAG